MSVSLDQDLAVDLCMRTDTEEGVIHLYNISWCKEEPAQADVEIVWESDIQTLTWIGWNREEIPVQFKKTDTGISFSIQNIRESAVIIVNKY